MAEYIKVTSASGKVHKLRIGAVCRNCKSDLTLENWSLGNGNICKSCINEYHKARRKGVWSW
jgi:hypothetical protein